MILEMGEISVKFYRSGFVSRCSFFRRFEKAKVCIYAFFSGDKCCPSIAIFSFVHAFYSGFIILLRGSVSTVLSVRSRAKFFPSETMCTPKSMINLFRWKFAGNNQPNDTMPKVHGSVDADYPITVVALASGYFAFFTARRTIYFPTKFSGFFVVAEQRTNVFGRQVRIARSTHAGNAFLLEEAV